MASDNKDTQGGSSPGDGDEAGDPKVEVSLEILGKEYRVSCPESERVGLENSAQMLDTRMREIQAETKVVGAERLAVISALNLVHELNRGLGQARECGVADTARMRSFLERLDDKVAAAVSNGAGK